MTTPRIADGRSGHHLCATGGGCMRSPFSIHEHFGRCSLNTLAYTSELLRTPCCHLVNPETQTIIAGSQVHDSTSLSALWEVLDGTQMPQQLSLPRPTTLPGAISCHSRSSSRHAAAYSILCSLVCNTSPSTHFSALFHSHRSAWISLRPSDAPYAACPATLPQLLRNLMTAHKHAHNSGHAGCTPGHIGS